MRVRVALAEHIHAHLVSARLTWQREDGAGFATAVAAACRGEFSAGYLYYQ